MNSSSFKPFNTSASNNAMSTPSPPIAVPSLEPVQEHNPASPSQQDLVFSFKSTKSLNSLKQEENEDKPGGLKVVTDDEMPKLEFEERQPKSTHSLPSLNAGSKSGTSRYPLEATHPLPSLQLGRSSKTIGEILGRNDDDLCYYRSAEVTKSLRKDKLLKSDGKNCHTNNFLMKVSVNRRKIVKVNAFLRPKIRENGSREKAMLYIKAEVNHKKLKTDNVDCWVLVESEVMDKQAGKNLGFTDLNPQAINIIDDGMVNFDQDLVACDEIKNCRSDYVSIVVKATFITCPRNVFTLHDTEDDFILVDEVT